MAIQYPNFGQMPIQKPWYDDLVGTLVEGFKAGRVPAMLNQEQEKAQQELDLNKLKMQMMPQEMQLKKALLQARINAANRPPMGSTPEILKLTDALKQYDPNSGEYAAIQNRINKLTTSAMGSSPEYLRLMQERKNYEPDSQEYKEISERMKYLQNPRQQAASGWTKLPMAVKNDMVATAVGLGYDPAEAAQLLNQGKNLHDLADAKGKNIGDTVKVYPLPNETINQMFKRGSYVAEIKDLEKNVNDAFSSVDRTIFGYSPKQVLSAISNKDPDEQGRILAARALQPELSALRGRAMGANIGIEIIKEMNDKALANLKVFDSLANEKVRKSMNKYINQWLSSANNASNRYLQQASTYQGVEPVQGNTFNLVTKRWE